MKKRILILGNYNALNIGDDLIFNGVKNVVTEYSDFFDYKFMAPNKPCDYFLLPTGLRSFVNFRWFLTILKFLKTDVLVLAGGGLLNPEEYRSLFVWGVQILAAKLFRVKVVILGNSFPISDSKFYRYLLNKVDFYTVRDDSSFNFINKLELNVPVFRGSDFAYSADFTNLIDKKLEFDADKFIVLNLREYSKIDYELQLNFYLDLVNFITLNTDFSVYLLPFAKEDVNFLRILNNKTNTNGRVFLLPYDESVLITAIERSKLVVSQRLHSSLIAKLLNKPVISLSYTSKTKSLMSEFDDIPVYDLCNKDFCFDDIKSVLGSILTGSYNIDIVKNMNTIEYNKKRAKMNFALLKSYLE